MFKAAIFDMDGLLIDSEPLWQEAEIEVFADLGVPLTRAECMETKGRRVDDTVAHWYARRPWRGASQPQVAERLVERVVARIRDRGRPKAGATEALEFFRRKGLLRALATSSGRLVIRAVLETLGLEEEFAVVHSAVDEEFGKPHPAVYLTAASLLGVEPARCLALEDSIHGVLAAKAAGMRCIAVPDASSEPAGGGARLVSSLADADLVLRSLDEVDEETWTRLVGLGG